MNARYAEYPPDERLTGLVRCVWTFEGEDAGEDQRIAPDGCAELVVHHRTPYLERLADGTLERQLAALLAGQLTRPLHLCADAPAGVTAVRFEPAGAWAFAGRPMSELTDRRVALRELHGPAADRLVQDLSAASEDAERRRIIQAYVVVAIAGRPTLRDPMVERCVAALQAADGPLSLEQLERLSGLAARQLQRRFSRAVGISARDFIAIVRFRRVFAALQEGDGQTWAQVAQAAGYFDHPQLAREFRRFVGCSPRAFIAAQAGLATSLVDLPA